MSWRDIAELRHYAGRATYKTTRSTCRELACPLNVEPGWSWATSLNPPTVHVNGIACGTRLLSPYRVDVSKCLAAGPNTIEIEVPNQLQNHLDQSAAYRARRVCWGRCDWSPNTSQY